MKRILVIRFGSLGDVVLTSAAVLNLKISFPDSRLTYLTKERFAPVVRRFDGVDEVVALADNGSLRDLLRVIAELEKRGFDLLVDLHGKPRSWLVQKLVTSSVKVSYPKRRTERVRTVRHKEFPGHALHTIDLYNEAVREAGGRTPATRPVLHAEETQFSPELEALFGSRRPVVAVAPGAAHANKQYPIERFAEAAVQIHEARGAGIVWAITATDRGKASPLERIGAEHGVELVDYPLEDLAAVLSRCAVTLANDSGIAHLASAVGTRVVAVFGPTHPALGFAPAGPEDVIIEVDEYCRPCSLHGAKPCFREERFCFTRIMPETVAAEVIRHVDRIEGRRKALFVDRDGTLIVDKDYLSDPDRVEFEPGAVAALKGARAAGYAIVIVSNQSGVARGYFDIEAVERVNARVLEMLAAEHVAVDGVYYCPHHSEGENRRYVQTCVCRKPAPGMAERAALELGLDLRQSWVIGDKPDDVNLARVIGGRGVLVRTGYGSQSETRFEAMRLSSRHGVTDNLGTAVKLITDREA